MVVIIWWLTVNEHLAGLPFLSSKKGQSFCFLLRGDLWEWSIGKSYRWAVKHYTAKNLLVWQKWSFRFFHGILWKNPNKCFVQPNANSLPACPLGQLALYHYIPNLEGSFGFITQFPTVSESPYYISCNNNRIPAVKSL